MAPEVPAGCKLAVEKSHAACEISGELKAFDEESFGGVTDHVLGHIVNVAAVSDAILETRVLKVAPPRVPQLSLVFGLSRCLWDASIRVTFGPAWSPLAGADIALGAKGSNGRLEDAILGNTGLEIANNSSE